MKNLEYEAPYITGSHFLSKEGFEAEPIRELIQRRRLQIIVHSCLYYKLNTSLVSDQKWQEWANELVVLQSEYPQISKNLDYHQNFKDFDGTTGFHLPFGGEVLAKAYQLLKYKEELHGGRKVRIETTRVRIPRSAQ